MRTDGFRLEHLVCETPAPERAPGFLWYEHDCDLLEAGTVPRGPLPAAAHLIAATRRGPSEALRKVLPHLKETAASHLQFEAGNDLQHSSRAVTTARDHGIAIIAAHHLHSPPATAAELRAAVLRLKALETPFIKIVFPVSAQRQVWWSIELLADWPHSDVALSLTPAGGVQARLAAALAGSRLVYAPLTDTRERMAAHWYRHLLGNEARTTEDNGARIS
ncbi:hypothetical protein [Streptomyces cellostaticus]|uniref:hypothetical protein n=1 Tax=Streptomyces cellostaticus TaxID=67285 RepID=UPI0020272CCD|nr:hypothetical protein [Streptomyces cellostaticus]